jgi:hypothetical protein
MGRIHLGFGLLALLLTAGFGCGDGDAGKPPPANGTAPAQGQDGPVVIGLEEKPQVLVEPEVAKCVFPFEVGEDADASGGKYLTIRPKSCDGNEHKHIAEEKDPARTAGSAELEFEVKEDGEYLLWVRKWTCCGCGDSWKMKIDDGEPFTFDCQGTTHRHWSWIAHQGPDGKVKFALKKGKHKLLLTNRGESGFRIDQILFSADPKRVPAGRERPRGGG